MKNSVTKFAIRHRWGGSRGMYGRQANRTQPNGLGVYSRLEQARTAHSKYLRNVGWLSLALLQAPRYTTPKTSHLSAGKAAAPIRVPHAKEKSCLRNLAASS